MIYAQILEEFMLKDHKVYNLNYNLEVIRDKGNNKM